MGGMAAGITIVARAVKDEDGSGWGSPRYGRGRCQCALESCDHLADLRYSLRSKKLEKCSWIVLPGSDLRADQIGEKRDRVVRRPASPPRCAPVCACSCASITFLQVGLFRVGPGARVAAAPPQPGRRSPEWENQCGLWSACLASATVRKPTNPIVPRIKPHVFHRRESLAVAKPRRAKRGIVTFFIRSHG